MGTCLGTICTPIIVLSYEIPQEIVLRFSLRICPNQFIPMCTDLKHTPKMKKGQIDTTEYSHHNRYTVGNYITITLHPHQKRHKCDNNKDKGYHKKYLPYSDNICDTPHYLQDHKHCHVGSKPGRIWMI